MSNDATKSSVPAKVSLWCQQDKPGQPSLLNRMVTFIMSTINSGTVTKKKMVLPRVSQITITVVVFATCILSTKMAAKISDN